MKEEKTHTIRSAFGKILSMNRTEDKSMIVSVEINFFSPSPKLYTNTKRIDIVFCVSGEIHFNTGYEEECMNSLEKYSEEEIKHKSNKIAEKYFTGRIIDEIASDIFGKTSIISAYPVRI
ncbi:MAG TPA: hypothetical protein PLS61_02775 [Candidatus Portnoybacteria bacterium]|nr:hypothetical protein [Candidatus Portnoybacteria bacterium]